MTKQSQQQQHLSEKDPSVLEDNTSDHVPVPSVLENCAVKC